MTPNPTSAPAPPAVTLSQIARKMAEQWTLTSRQLDRTKRNSWPESYALAESAIREAMLHGIEHAQEAAAKAVESQIGSSSADNDRWLSGWRSGVKDSADYIRTLQLKSELIPSTSPDEKGNL